MLKFLYIFSSSLAAPSENKLKLEIYGETGVNDL